MLADRWEEIERLYHSALERRLEDRQAYLESVCGDDEVLRCEVESLLASDDLAGNFLETTEPEIKKNVGEPPIPSGALIGPYAIVGFLSAGGMGEVYKARDSRLDRTVAIKFLPAVVATDTVAFERFQREARAASALNHPRICTIYDVGEHQGRPFIVMEFLEGGSLRDRIVGKALPVADLLHIVIQICEGLQAAHAKGIIHRDVKPGNISVGDGGAVKILDFGVAKVGWGYRTEGSPVAAGPESPATKVSFHLTRAGTLTGTLAYLSPEQARGEEVDPTTDIFSLGAVMYEMATGRKAFRGESATDVLNAILTESPPRPSESNGAVPRSLERIIEKALAKERSSRYQSAEDLLRDLRALTTSAGRRPVIAASILALLICLAAAAWFATRPGSSPKAQSFMQLTDNPGEELYPSLAPDGKSFVYQSRASGRWEIYSKRVGAQNPISLTKESGSDDTQPAISPDGERVAFRSERDGGGIFVMGLSGDNARRLTNFCYNPAWSPDGKEIVCSTGFFFRPEERGPRARVYRVNVTNGEARPISEVDDGLQPNWSPHGYRIAYWGSPKGTRRIWTVAAAGGEPVPVTEDVSLQWSPVWSPDGRYLYFSSDRAGSMNLWRIRIDEASGKPLGTSEQFTTPAQSSGLMSFSRDGRQMAYVSQARDLNLYKVGFDSDREASSGESVAVTAGSTPLADPDFSPDGQWIAFNSHLTPQNLFLVRSDGTGLHQLAEGGQMDRCPRWSPDGTQIAFSSVRTGKWQVWTIMPNGRGMERRTDELEGLGARLPKWLPDGRLLYRTDGPGVIIDPAKMWKEQSLQALPNPQSGAWFASEAWSPDGRLLAGELRQSDGGFWGLTVYRVDSQTYERIGPTGPSPNARWLPDSRRLLFLRDGKIDLIDSQTKRTHEVFTAGSRRNIFSFGFSSDGRWIAFTVEVAEADIWLMDLR